MQGRSKTEAFQAKPSHFCWQKCSVMCPFCHGSRGGGGDALRAVALAGCAPEPAQSCSSRFGKERPSPAGGCSCAEGERTGLVVIPHILHCPLCCTQGHPIPPTGLRQLWLCPHTPSPGTWHMSHVCASSSQQLVTPRTCVSCVQLVCVVLSLRGAVIPIACSPTSS